LGNNQDNFQLHRFTTSENIARSFRGLLFGLTLYFFYMSLCCPVTLTLNLRQLICHERYFVRFEHSASLRPDVLDGQTDG